MDNKSILRRAYQKKFDIIKQNMISIPHQGWLRTIRECLGMTTTQLSKVLGVSQPRVMNMEKNERSLKLSTMERVADMLNCEFFYILVPRERIEDRLYNQAREKAKQILRRVNKNMELENQLADTEELLEDIVQELLGGNIARIWDSEE